MTIFTLDIHIFCYFIAIFLNIAGFIQDIFYYYFVLFYLYIRNAIAFKKIYLKQTIFV